GLSCGIGYRTDLFEAETIRCMLEHWQVLLQGIVRSPQSRISELPLLSNAERQRLLVEWNATRLSLPVEPCLHTLFERQAVCTPDAVALVSEEGSLSYATLDQMANYLASYLISLGVSFQTPVALCYERSLDAVIA